MTRLVDATIDAIVEGGYSRATTREICKRAAVSQGGMFRHFQTRHDVIVAALIRIYERQIPPIMARLAPDLGGDDPVRIAEQVRITREAIRNPDNVVFIEIVMASRTEPELRHSLRPLFDRAEDDTLAWLCRNPVVARMPPKSRQVWLDIARQVLWVETIWAGAVPDDLDEERRVDALVRLLFMLAGDERARPR